MTDPAADSSPRGRVGWLVLAILCWVILGLAVLGFLASLGMGTMASPPSADGAYLFGRIFGTLLTFGIPLALALLFTRKYRRSKTRP